MKQLNSKYKPQEASLARKKITDALEQLENRDMSAIDKKLLRGLMRKKIEDEEDILSESECEDIM